MEVTDAVARRGGGREIEEGVVRGEVVAMVDSGEMVEVGMREKGGRVEAEHEQIERRERSE